MAPPEPVPDVAQQWQLAQRIEKQIYTMIKEKEARAEDIENAIQELRIACEVAIFLDIEYAAREKIEERLWSVHIQINARYRKIIARFTKDTQKKNTAVEKRKWEKRYVDFLKTSQFFYKGFVQRLASHYDITELRKVAHRLQLDTLAADERVKLSSEAEAVALLSCHTTLLRLGDLSRYRNVLRTKDRSWDVAFAYYSLANDLFPSKGMAFNQMAVISTIDNDHLLVIYHLYRALAIEEPVPMAPGNLAIQFKKIIEDWTGTKKILSRQKTSASGSNVPYPLVLWFVRLHARLYRGEEFDLHDETENEVLSQLTLALKEKSLEGIIDKFVLINIAAQDFAGERLRESFSEDIYQSYKFLLRLNVRVTFMLLQVLQPELSFDHSRPDANGKSTSNVPENITPVMRRVLPALRHYSTWLVSKVGIIDSQSSESNNHLSLHIREMWAMYASTLNMLVSAFDIQDLPSVDYLLEEDAATIGFKPLRELQQWSNYLDREGNLKPRTTDFGIARSHPSIEMLARVKDLLRDGMILGTKMEECPIQVLDRGTFQFVEAGLPTTSPVAAPLAKANLPSTARSQQNHSIKDIATSSPYTTSLGNAPLNQPARPSSPAKSESYQSMGTEMYNMVDELTSPSTMFGGYAGQTSNISKETSYGMHDSTKFEVFGKDPQRPTSRHQSNVPLFVESSPFAPRPGELPNMSGERTMTGVRLGSLHINEDGNLLTPSKSFEARTGSSMDQRSNPWSSPVPGFPASASPGSQNVANNFLQKQLADQYMPFSGSTNDTSVYGGNPTYGSGLGAGGPFGPHSRKNAHSTTSQYDSISAFDRAALLQSSLYDGSQPAAIAKQFPGTPPGGQGG